MRGESRFSCPAGRSGPTGPGWRLGIEQGNLAVEAKATDRNRRICGRIVAEVRKHLDEAIGRSFLSGDFRAHLRALTMEKLSVFGQDV